ncbi:hypothetical protein [Thermoanaerobacter wiegelii]|uniref:Uncharacterized protein n=1 Tax=Thermoanaerobacter wiegelii Rt8.B1 TaxID=697303 RepID=G2MSU0_9THEO|nr:hypothetical protein [Thermoanaerobacter wiegelii]AEM78155.1 hypothetical protein Thewi_0702 [Thermoanaerobacter wiegelii Rt8.B1]
MSKRFLAALLIIIVSIAIIFYHFYEYLKIFASNPSDMWSRELAIGEKT